MDFKIKQKMKKRSILFWFNIFLIPALTIVFVYLPKESRQVFVNFLFILLPSTLGVLNIMIGRSVKAEIKYGKTKEKTITPEEVMKKINEANK